jgi:hypothetical protein
MAGYVARMGEKRNAYRLEMRKPEGESPLGRPRREWIILRLILERQDEMGYRLDWSGSG